MAFEDVLIPVIIALIHRVFPRLGYFVKAQISAIEQRYRADLERWRIDLPQDPERFGEPFPLNP